MRIKLIQQVIDKIRNKRGREIIIPHRSNNIEINKQVKNKINLNIAGKDNKV